MPQPFKRSPWRSLGRMAWQVPLWALPFAVFFGLLFGRGVGSFLESYWISLTFATSIALCYRAADWILGRTAADDWRPATSSKRLIMAVGRWTAPSIVGSIAAALVVHWFIFPGFLGSVRSILITLSFTLIFTALFAGVVFATIFYRKAVEGARVEQELAVARRIQTSFLCCVFPDIPGVDLHAVNVPSREVSGDFYDVVPMGDGAWLLAVADVAGKGVPAALLAAMLQASIRTQASLGPPLPAVMRALNRLVRDGSPRQHFATCFLARLEAGPRRLTYVNAGHSPPVLVRARGDLEELPVRGVGLGLLADATYQAASVELAEGDRVICFTDGIVEARNAAGEQFDDSRLKSLAGGWPSSLGSGEAIASIIGQVGQFLDGAEPHDDMTVLALRIEASRVAAATRA